MIDFFDYWYGNIKGKNIFLTKTRFYSLQRLSIRKLANVIIPIYLNLFKSSLKLSESRITGQPRVIVSLTTFPLRIEKLWMVIESIYRQSYLPDRIVLWLAKSQFDSLDSLPKSLLFYINKGLEINFIDEDVRSHKKYLYALKKFPNDILITIDDDILYNSRMLNQLMIQHKKYPKVICCKRAYRYSFVNDRLDSYKNWEQLSGETMPEKCIFFTSGGGTLFPPNCLHSEVFNQITFMKICKNADDIWLNIMALFNGTLISKVESNHEVLPLLYKGGESLSTINVAGGDNDHQMSNLRDFMLEKYSADIWEMLRP